MRAMWCAVLCASLLLSGCARKMRLRVSSAPETNDGRSMLMVVREVDLPTYLTESYGDITDLIARQDSSIIETVTLLPGEKEKVRVRVPDSSVAVYVMFTEPVATEWRVFYQKPPRRKRLWLERGRIQ